MAIKVEIEECDDENKNEYPCLKKSQHGNLVLFWSKNKGLSLTGGYYSETWIENKFELVKGKITLSNE